MKDHDVYPSLRSKRENRWSFKNLLQNQTLHKLSFDEACLDMLNNLTDPGMMIHVFLIKLIHWGVYCCASRQRSRGVINIPIHLIDLMQWTDRLCFIEHWLTSKKNFREYNSMANYCSPQNYLIPFSSQLNLVLTCACFFTFWVFFSSHH